MMTGALAFGIAALSHAPAFAAPTVASATITVSPDATVGDTVDATIALGATTDTYAFELTVDYDPSVLDYVDDSATAPAGGFDDVQDGDGTLTILHTRLGTSPSLSGDLSVAVQFVAIGEGVGDLDLSSVTLVGADGVSTALAAPSSAPLDVSAAVVPPTPPAPDPTPGPTGGAIPAQTPDGDDGSGPLAFTGADAAPGIAIGLGALLAGLIAVTVAVIRRRREALTR